jgi:hypothetical protein
MGKQVGLFILWSLPGSVPESPVPRPAPKIDIRKMVDCIEAEKRKIPCPEKK